MASGFFALCHFAGRTLLAILELLCAGYGSIGHLSMAEDHMLRDIGLTRAQVALEIRKPFWRS